MKQFANWPVSYPSPEWFIHDRFGLFIHFGLYSIGARHEWFMTTEEIDPQTYRETYFDFFDPDLFDAQQWAKAAKKPGSTIWFSQPNITKDLHFGIVNSLIIKSRIPILNGTF